MLTIKEIYDILNEISPFNLQSSWDNSGLNLGSLDSIVNKIYVALELDFKVLEFIESSNCMESKDADSKDSVLKNSVPEKCMFEDSICPEAHASHSCVITHHPLIFKPIKNFLTNTYPCNLIESCLKNNISVISMHTNFDITHLNKAFAKKLALENLGFKFYKEIDFSLIYAFENKNLENENLTSNPADSHIYNQAQNFQNLAKYVKKTLNLKTLHCSQASESVNNIFVTSGSNATSFNLANVSDCVITGDIKYHEAMMANSQGVSFIEVPHFESECIFATLLSSILGTLKSNIFTKHNIPVIIAHSHNPFCYL